MSRKNLILTLVLLALLGLAYYYRGPYQAKQDLAQVKYNFFKDLQPSLVDKIVIGSANKSTELIKADATWQFAKSQEFKVNQDAVSNLLDQLAQSASSSVSLASEAEDTKVLYETDALKGKSLQVWQGENKIIDLVVGKGQVGLSYISEVDKPASYQLMSDLASALMVSDWRDLKIFSADPSTATSLSIQSASKSKAELKLTKDRDQWYANKTKLNLDKVRALLNPMTNLYASAIPEQNLVKAGLDRPALTITLTGPDYKHSLLVGKASGENYFVKNAATANIYLVNKASIEVFQTEVRQLQ